MNDSKFCLVRSKKTDGYGSPVPGYPFKGPLTLLQECARRLRVPFKKECDIERAVESAELIEDLRR
jgi:hypothetical protein